jgi:SAM-dependent methyltransferase
MSASHVESYKKDFWDKESPKFASPHYRLLKAARLINKIAGTTECTLLDIGCGPATLATVLAPNIRYYGIDLAIQDPAPNLLEADILATPIKFGDLRFDIILAQGLFEYLADAQDEKFTEIAQLLTSHGTFIVSYTNFSHRQPEVYHAFSNVQPMPRFRSSLERHFIVRRAYPTAYNWKHGLPGRPILKRANMHLNISIPFVAPRLAVEYFFVCSPRRQEQS